MLKTITLGIFLGTIDAGKMLGLPVVKAPGAGDNESMAVFGTSSFTSSSGGSLPSIGPPGATDVASQIMTTISSASSRGSGAGSLPTVGPPGGAGGSSSSSRSSSSRSSRSSSSSSSSTSESSETAALPGATPPSAGAEEADMNAFIE